jgi:hypothetical protein
VRNRSTSSQDRSTRTIDLILDRIAAQTADPAVRAWATSLRESNEFACSDTIAARRQRAARAADVHAPKKVPAKR